MAAEPLAQWLDTEETSSGGICKQRRSSLPLLSDPHRVRNRCSQRLDSRRRRARTGGSMPEVTVLHQAAPTQLHGHQVQHSDTQQGVIIDGAVVPFTPTEHTLLLPLLYH